MTLKRKAELFGILFKHIANKEEDSYDTLLELGMTVNEIDETSGLYEPEDEEDYNELLWNKLKEHWGHTIEIAVYGDPDDPDDICIEDMDTNEVILDAELYTLCGRDDID